MKANSNSRGYSVTTTGDSVGELHPTHYGARVMRALRAFSSIRGWERLSNLLVPDGTTGRFRVRNQSGVFAGDLSSFIDRSMYLRGGYEQNHIRAFIACVPADRRGIVLDVGANVGTHSLAFSQHFRAVHAFEPNPSLWDNFKMNVCLNNLKNISLHRFGLADTDDELTFYLINKKNYGLGTCSTIEQYDLPLQAVCKVKVAVGDDFLNAQQIGPIDAVKIDVQGFEPECIRGLRRVLERDRPFVWVEVAGGTQEKVDTIASLKALFPYRSELYCFSSSVTRGLCHDVRLRPVEAKEEALISGDYLVAPKNG